MKQTEFSSYVTVSAHNRATAPNPVGHRVLRPLNYAVVCFAVLSLIMLSGCARMQAHEIDTRLNDSVRAYSKALRWGDFRRAALFVRHRDGSPAVVPEYSGKLRVIGVNAEPGRVPGEEKEAIVPIRIEYVDPTTSRVDVFEATQVWWYDEQAKRWFVDDDVPHLGKS